MMPNLYGITNLRTFEVVKVDDYYTALEVAAGMSESQIVSLDENEMPKEIVATHLRGAL
jgi:hypothetical protein